MDTSGAPSSEQTSSTTQANSLKSLLERTTPRLAFRFGFLTGALALAGVFFAFMFAFVIMNRDAITTAALQEGTGAAVDTGVAAQGALPDPFPVVEGDVELFEDDHIRGDADADYVLIEYSDFECPYCKNFHPTAETLLEEGVNGKSLAWVYRHYPLYFHEGAHEAAQASECVAELGGQDVFWAFTDAYYDQTVSNGWGLARDKWADVAIAAGMPASQRAVFETCVDSGKYAENVDMEQATGDDLGVTGTPGNILLNTKTGKARIISGAYPLDSFEEVALLLE